MLQGEADSEVWICNNEDCDARWSIPFCLSTRMHNLLDMNQTKYLIRPIIMIIAIIRIKNKTRKWTPSLIINSLTYGCVSGGKNFFKICSYFMKQNSLEWFEILKTNEDMGRRRTLFRN